jgi:hypothetical protein
MTPQQAYDTIELNFYHIVSELVNLTNTKKKLTMSKKEKDEIFVSSAMKKNLNYAMKIALSNTVFWLNNPEAYKVHLQRSERNENNVHLAYIRLKGATKDTMAYVDKVTNKAYKIGNSETEYYPNTWMEYRNFTFVRWCRGMDL